MSPPFPSYQLRRRMGEHGGQRLTTPMAFAHMVKAVMGAGSFALPWAFSQSGVVLGPLLLFATAAMSCFTHIMLAKVRRKVSSQHGGYRVIDPICKSESGEVHTSPLSSPRQKGSARGDGGHLLSYINTAEAVFGPAGGRTVLVCTLFASLGVCSAYVVFITENACSILASDCRESERVWITSTAVVGLVLLSWLRDMRKLAFTSTLGDIAILCGGLVVFVAAVSEPRNEVPAAIFSTLPLAFGTIAFLFCTQFLSLPVEGAMAHPDQWPYAVAGAFTCCAVFNAGFGVAGAIAWGSEVQPIVILNLPGGVISNMVKICLCVDLFLTFPIVIYPSIDLLESQEAIKALMPPSGSNEEYWSKNLLRATLVVATALIAHNVPHFGLLTDLFGGFGQTLLAFVAPPLMWMTINKKFGVAHLWAICCYGLLACVFTVAMSLEQLSEKLRA